MFKNNGIILFAWRLAMRILVISGLIFLDPFGLNEITERASIDVFAKLASPWYPTTERNRIVIVSIDEADLPLAAFDCALLSDNEPTNEKSPPLSACNSPTWPITFAEHAALVEAIVGDDPAGYPAAVFVDILFNNPHLNDPTFGTLAAVAARGGTHRAEGYPPIIFATEPDQLFDPSLPRAAAVEGARSLIETVDGAQTSHVSWIGGNYPMTVADEGEVEKTAAATLYELITNKHLDDSAPRVFTIWGYQPVEGSRYLHTEWNADPIERACPSASSAFGRIGVTFQAALSGALANVRDEFDASWRLIQPCSFHAEIAAAELLPANFESEFRFRDKLAGSVVIVAANIAGNPDRIVSPVHGALPGAHFHAMAFDNLLVFDGSYFRASPEISMLGLSLPLSAVLEILILFVGIVCAAAISFAGSVGWRAKAAIGVALVILSLGLLVVSVFFAHSPALNWLGALTLAIGNILQAVPRGIMHNQQRQIL